VAPIEEVEIMKRFISLTVLILSLLAMPALGAVPQTLSYQGVLTDGAGAIVPDANYRITFRIYDDPILGGPHLLWTEAHDGVTAPVVPVNRGGFNVVLGTAIPVNVKFNGPMWLELQVDPDPTPMTPRTELTPAPFALNARNIFDGGANNFVGVGRANQVSPFEYFGILAPVASGFGGMYIQTQGAATLPFYGYYTGSASAWTYLDGSNGNSWKVNNNGDRLTVTNTGEVGIGTTSPTATLEVRGGTKLGGAIAPAIKMMKLTGTTSAVEGGQSNISLGGIDPTKIVAVDVIVEYSPSSFVPPSYLVNTGYEYSWYMFGPGGNISIWNRTGNSASILSKPVRVLVTYEE
jgi:hypothetical protein